MAAYSATQHTITRWHEDGTAYEVVCDCGPATLPADKVTGMKQIVLNADRAYRVAQVRMGARF